MINNNELFGFFLFLRLWSCFLSHFILRSVKPPFVFDLAIKNKSNGLSSLYHVVVAILLVMGGENWSNLIPSCKSWHLACTLYFSDITCVAGAWGREPLGSKVSNAPRWGVKMGLGVSLTIRQLISIAPPICPTFVHLAMMILRICFSYATCNVQPLATLK